jgi:glutamine amidotransferase
MISIINYGTGNTGSIHNMLKKINVKSVITDDKNIIEKSSKIILPGVGSYGRAVRQLKNKDLFNFLLEVINRQEKYILGVCLGMQLLCLGSEEEDEIGFGYFKNKCIKFPYKKDTLSTFIGWSQIKSVKENCFVEKGDLNKRFYFLHSYYYPKDENTLATANNGLEYSSIISRGKIIGAQFHPERSHNFGISFFKSFNNL